MLALLVVIGMGWLSSVLKSTSDNTPPNDNTDIWVEIFPGYENYFDNSVSYSPTHGTSMEPTFGEGDAVIWTEVENIAELRVGDIIIYDHPTKPDEGRIAHRIIDITIDVVGYRFETKGDNRTESDAETEISRYYVRENDIIGLVIGVLHNVG